MKHISNEEFENLPKRGPGPSGIVYSKIFNLKVGENLHVEKKDWNRTDTPNRLCRYIEKRNPGVKYQAHTLANEMGWAIKRIS